MGKYFGKVAIIGSPNVGKSSLLNKIIDDKISIVNKKPQATRNNIRATLNNDKYYLQFIDTPGFHNKKNKLDEFLNKQVLKSFKEVDLIYFLLDSSTTINDEDLFLLNLLKKNNLPIILVITKKDLSNSEKIKNTINNVSEHYNFSDVAIISVNDENSINNLLTISEKYLEKNLQEFCDIEQTIQDDLFLVKEIIREQCLNLLSHEIPYGLAVVIDNFKYDKTKNVFFIDAAINVEKESHKKIVIGQNGTMIKQIGSLTRNELLKIYDAKIYLKLFVKVSKNWRNDQTKLKEFGYS